MSTAWLQEMMKFRNDPALAAEIDAHARAGHVDAQFAMGLLYAEGRGVPLDRVKSYAWLTVAITSGDRDAEDLRYIVLQDMTDTEVDRARSLAFSLTGRSGTRQ
jgi:TPR repeat protein